MTAAERQKIYTLLAQYFPNARQLRDRATITAWGYILEDFTYEDVKSAVIKYAARNKYFPDPADITGGLVPVTAAEEQASRHASPSSAELASMAATRALVEDMGGPCQILRNGTGMCGLALRRAVPDGCEDCGYLSVNSSCHERDKIMQEQAQCRILTQHHGEAPKAQLLESLWKTECPMCHDPCFWFDGMRMKENEA